MSFIGLSIDPTRSQQNDRYIVNSPHTYVCGWDSLVSLVQKRKLQISLSNAYKNEAKAGEYNRVSMKWMIVTLVTVIAVSL